MPRIFFFVLSIILLQLSVPFGLAQAEIWEAGLKLPDSDKAIEFLLEIETGQTQDRIGRSTPRVFVRNGTEKIEVPSVDFRLGYTRFSFSHYDSVITTQISRAEFIGGISESTEMRGEFKKRRGGRRVGQDGVFSQTPETGNAVGKPGSIPWKMES